MRTTLYKLDSSSRLREWTAWIENHSNKSYVFIRHGLSGGQQPIETLEFPNHLASSPLARSSSPGDHISAATEEYHRRVTKQIQRRGYTSDIPKSRPLKPMLALVYQNNKHHVPPRCFIQPKLNGLRCLASNRWMMSRKEVNFYSLPHIQLALEALPPEVILDGELYLHKSSLQTIMSCCRRDEPQIESYSVTYHVYDIADPSLAYTDRLSYLQEIIPQLQSTYDAFPLPITNPLLYPPKPIPFPITLVDTLEIPSKEIDEHYQYHLSQGYEGSIIRNPFTPYESDTRSLGLLKYKPRQVITCKILDVLPTKANHNNGKLYLYSPMHTKFTCSVKGNESFKRYILYHKTDFIGRLCEVEFEDYSADNVPIQPVCTKIFPPAKATTC